MSSRKKRNSSVQKENSFEDTDKGLCTKSFPEECSNIRSTKIIMGSEDIVRILPHQYIHVLDLSTNVTRVEVGPQTFVRKDHERVVLGPTGMIIVPPQHYCIIRNPVIRNSENQLILDKLGQIRLSHADLEVRLSQEPFPLYPGEELERKVTTLTVVATNTALLLRAARDLQDGDLSRIAGDEWLFEGPGTYIPRKEVEVLSTISAIVIKPNQALKLRAEREMKDRQGVARVTGEEWLVRKPGSYLPDAYEKIVTMVEAHVLTEKTAIHVHATRTFNDDRGRLRKNGEEWLIKLEDMETYIPGVYESVKGVVHITTLTDKQYCVICDPVGEDGKPQFGQRELVQGEKSFFLLPGELLESGIQGNYVLGENEGLLLRANQAFTDDSMSPSVDRKPGDRWLITGNLEYVPPIQVEVLEHRSAIPLHDNEGIYVRNTKTGHVRAVIGKTYMLTQDEELWEKHVPPTVRELLSPDHDALADRSVMVGFAMDSMAKQRTPGYTRVITYQVPHNAAVQIYDYKDKKSRVIFGPDLVMLGPDEQFTQLSLSGGRPKKPNTIRSLALLLGPDFFTDVITVETADHARLSLQLAYNWHFGLGDKSIEDATRLFNIPDFVGDASKALASRIRGAVASVNFDHFHKNSAYVIRTAVFGSDENGKVRDAFVFPQNSLVITSVDIQNVEPVDQRTRDALQKSVQLAIEITTNSQEASAKHEAERLEQEAKGRLERQKLMDAASSEKARTDLLELKAASAGVESRGLAEAEARSRTHAARIVAEGAVMEARLKAKATRIETNAELERLEKARVAELTFMREKSSIEIAQAKEMSVLEANSFKQMVESIGSDNLRMMATAGPEQQVRLLKALGLKSTIITDGRTPLNLLSTGLGLIGAGPNNENVVAPLTRPSPELDD